MFRHIIDRNATRSIPLVSRALHNLPCTIAVTDGNECAGVTCENGGTCEDLDLGYRCRCDTDSGVTGPTCQCEYLSRQRAST